MSKFIIQQAVPRFQSIRVKLSDDAYQAGLSAFSREGIPHSTRTSPYFAHKVIHLLITKLKADHLFNSKTPIHLYEFGAGSGALAHNILDQLKRKHSKLYDRVIIHLSDISEKSINTLCALPIFEPFAGHIAFNILDMTQADYPEDSPPYLIYHTYLINSLPSRFIYFKEDEIFELLIQTSIPENTIMFNNTIFPPTIINAHQIRTIVYEDSLVTRQPLGWRIRDLIFEEIAEIPLHLSTMSEREKQELIDFRDFYKPTHNFTFSYMPIISESFRMMKAYPNASMLFSDFGFWDPSRIEGYPGKYLMSEYGQTVAHPVFFPIVKFTAEQSGFQCLVNIQEFGHTQDMYVYPTPSMAIVSMFQSTFNEIGDERITEFLKLLDTTDTIELIRTINKAPEMLHPLELKEYYFMIMVAFRLMDHQKHDQAILWGKKVIKHYPQIAATAYLVVATSYVHKNNPNHARRYMDKAIALAPNISYNYRLLSAIYYDKKNFTEFLRIKALEMIFCREAPLGRLYEMCMVGIQLKQMTQVKEMVQHLLTLSQAINTFSDEEKEYVTLLKELETAIQ